MPTAAANGITLEYETFGDHSDPAVLLIMGFTGQLTLWDADFCAALADTGHYVIRYDNRDVGLSTWLDDAGAPTLAELGSGAAEAPYSIADMADDAAGLLDAVGIARAHIVGASMGGMIAQAFAIDHPERTLTLTSIMSTTGDPSGGRATADAIPGATLLLVPGMGHDMPPALTDRFGAELTAHFATAEP